MWSSTPTASVPLELNTLGKMAATSAVRWDIKSVPKAETFSGKVEDWIEWSFAFRSYAFVLGIQQEMRAVDAMRDPPETVDMTPEIERSGELLCHVLLKLLKGKARLIAMSSEQGNGYKLWYELIRSYESKIPGRHQAMLMSLLKPERWTGVKGDAFESELLDWELDIQRYEHQIGKKFDDDNKVATVMRWGPEELRGSLLTGDPRNRDNYTPMLDRPSS